MPTDALRVALAGLQLLAGQGDTLRIPRTGAADFRITVPQGEALVTVTRTDSQRVRLRVVVPDATPSWRDGIAILLDPVGDATPEPGHDDLQLDFRRTLDSSVVRQGVHGRWMEPASDPDWRLGTARGMETWTVASESTPTGWVLELLIDEGWLAGTPAQAARLGLLLHDDAPNRWSAWPAMGDAAATMIERRPARWAVVRLVD